ncbi:MAG TPA: hypothetical protein VJG49_04525 [Candidatus Nanoarchaeia archaeon]|nr:hypothetical protein [Candidatus Nanoarchaeia archaeon]
MVSRAEKRRAVTFICDLLENSGFYTFGPRDHHILTAYEKFCVRDDTDPRTIQVVIPNFFASTAEYHQALAQNRADRVYTASVLYKDGETAFVRAIDSSNSIWRRGSLKKYTKEQRNQMLWLRNVERRVLDQRHGNITYYQPETDRLPESLREFSLASVDLNYDHLTIKDPPYPYVENRSAVVFKMPQETRRIIPEDNAAQFHFNSAGLAWIVTASIGEVLDIQPEEVEADLLSEAQYYFPGLAPEEALAAYKPAD